MIFNWLEIFQEEKKLLDFQNLLWTLFNFTKFPPDMGLEIMP